MRIDNLHWLTLLAVLTGLLGCLKANEAPQVGTNTNWLKACASDAECANDRSCLCGVCTLSCERDEQCASVHEATTCTSVRSACGERAAQGAACLEACRSDAECTSIEHPLCVARVCTPQPGQSETDDAGAQAVGGGPETVDAGPDIPPESDLTLTHRDGTVLISASYTSCATHEECTVVGTSCGCCELGAVNTSLTQVYEREKVNACAGYPGPICDCDFPQLVARCELGRCQTIERSTLSCYGPTQNLELASQSGTVGCRCDKPAARICIDSVALACEAGPAGSTTFWTRVADATCLAAVDTFCDGGSKQPDAASCLAQFDRCYSLGNNAFCGRE